MILILTTVIFLNLSLNAYCAESITITGSPIGTLVAFSGTGASGSLTPMMKLILALSKTPEAELHYLTLLDSNTIENKIYGLAGLRIHKIKSI